MASSGYDMAMAGSFLVCYGVCTAGKWHCQACLVVSSVVYETLFLASGAVTNRDLEAGSGSGRLD